MKHTELLSFFKTYGVSFTFIDSMAYSYIPRNESEYSSWKWRAMYFRRLVFILLSNIFIIIAWIHIYRDFYYGNDEVEKDEIGKRKPYNAWSNIYPIIPGFIFFHLLYGCMAIVRSLVPMFSFGKVNRKWSFLLLNTFVMATVICSTHQSDGIGYVMGFVMSIALQLTHHLGFSDAVTVGMYCLYLILGAYFSVVWVSYAYAITSGPYSYVFLCSVV